MQPSQKSGSLLAAVPANQDAWNRAQIEALVASIPIMLQRKLERYDLDDDEDDEEEEDLVCGKGPVVAVASALSDGLASSLL